MQMTQMGLISLIDKKDQENQVNLRSIFILWRCR